MLINQAVDNGRLRRLNPSRVDNIPIYQTFNQYYELFRVVDHKPQNDPMTLSTSFQIVPANSYLPKDDNSSMETFTNVLMIRQSNDKSYKT